ncbi:MAG TPA: hypothetical protein VFE51_25845 [Verrucomicrobiae bacterium]|nr:hypothetical protein [Verrucomicrobiae bacterium]
MKIDNTPQINSGKMSLRFSENQRGGRVRAFIVAGAAALALWPGSIRAGNLLVNPSFESSSGHATYSTNVQPATGWTYFSPPEPSSYFGDYWVESAVAAKSGTFYWKQWGALYNPGVSNVAGIYQSFSAAPGSVYQASGWLYTRGNDTIGAGNEAWVQVEFLGANSNLLALYKTDNFDSTVGTDSWFQYLATNACDVTLPVSVGDPYFTTYAVTGSVSQLVAPPGTKTVVYRYCFLQAGTSGGSAYLDDAVLNQVSGPIPPVISNVFPLNMIFVAPSNGLSFNVSSPAGFIINNSGIGLVLNGTNVSANLVISGSSSNKNVSYHGLQSNLTYTASITVTDSFGFTASQNSYFETTWVGIPPIVYLWEAEDFDFTNGMYFDQPALCNTPGSPNCYFGTVGNEGTDEHSTGSASSHLYRPDDAIGTSISGDYLRKDHADAGALDYRIDPFITGSWVDYTRDWPTGTFWVIARLSTDINLSGDVTLSQVNADQSTTDLGTFTITSGRGWSSYDNVYLKDTNGNIAAVTLNGKATLRLTSGGNLLPNFLALVAGQIDQPQISALYPTGLQPFENTNTLSFSVTSSGATIPATGIKLNLDGIDVSSNLLITGSASTKSVVFSPLQTNAVHLAVITITNSLGHGILISNSFDTFSQDNYMVEAEDFDYNGGQFITPWTPDAYAALGAVTNVDFQHTPFAGQAFPYRTDGIPEGKTGDFLRQAFVDVLGTDYDLTWFGNGDWANYTRDYPQGSFYVYGRFSGLGSYTMDLDEVISGAGGTNQVTKRLGRWGAIGAGYNIYNWVPLRDDSLSVPVVVKLTGQETLRIATTGNSNPNFFMLVPVSGISVSAIRTSGNILLSFPTQPGVIYRVFYSSTLASGNWTLVSTVAGDGTTKSVSESSGTGSGFYKVVAP